MRTYALAQPHGRVAAFRASQRRATAATAIPVPGGRASSPTRQSKGAAPPPAPLASSFGSEPMDAVAAVASARARAKASPASSE